MPLKKLIPRHGLLCVNYNYLFPLRTHSKSETISDFGVEISIPLSAGSVQVPLLPNIILFLHFY